MGHLVGWGAHEQALLSEYFGKGSARLTRKLYLAPGPACRGAVNFLTSLTRHHEIFLLGFGRYTARISSHGWQFLLVRVAIYQRTVHRLYNLLTPSRLLRLPLRTPYCHETRLNIV